MEIYRRGAEVKEGRGGRKFRFSGFGFGKCLAQSRRGAKAGTMVGFGMGKEIENEAGWVARPAVFAASY